MVGYSCEFVKIINVFLCVCCQCIIQLKCLVILLAILFKLNVDPFFHSCVELLKADRKSVV